MFIYLFRWNRLLKLFSFLTCKLRMHFAHHSLFTHTACSCGNLRQVTQVSLFFFFLKRSLLSLPPHSPPTCTCMYNGLCETSTQFFNTITYCSYHLPFSFSASMKACKTFSLISEVLQNPSSAGRGRDVLLALFLSKNYKVLHHSVQYFKQNFKIKHWPLTPGQPTPYWAPILTPFKMNGKETKAQNYQ